MGAYSTLQITRKEALQMIDEAVRKLEDATNEEISDALSSLVSEKTCHNYTIVE
jgi:hypothetical protein